MTREQYQTEINEVTKDFSEVVTETITLQVLNSWFKDFNAGEGRAPVKSETLKFIESEAYLRNYLDYAKEMKNIREQLKAQFMNS